MRVPIAYGLAWPERIESGADTLDVTALAGLSFRAPDAERFPGLFLAWQALAAPEGTTAVLNAANEEAVSAFLDGRIGFLDIHRVNAATLEQVRPGVADADGVDALLALDERARAQARQLVKGLTR
jgi:1-deoxy-D-xylulose-5-phosphate reductoisomerase